MNIVIQGSNLKIILQKNDLPHLNTTKHILDVYNYATQDEKNFDWYKQANQFAKDLSEKYNISFDKVVKVIAILSPMQRWETNKKMAEKCLDVFVSFYPIMLELTETHNLPLGELVQMTNFPMVQTFTHNSQNAYKVLFDFPIELGEKVNSFYNNILMDKNYVTVDSLATAIAIGLYNHPGSFMPKHMYNDIAKLYVDAANQLGILPSQLQAITWSVCRRLRTANYGDRLIKKVYDENPNINLSSFVQTVRQLEKSYS